jgi:hypothetical protein
VQEATQDDKRKLGRVLGYLKGTAKACPELGQKSRLQLEAYIDAAFASHPDSKSHTEVVILAGGSLVYVASKKAEIYGQKINRGLISGSYQKYWTSRVGP